MSNEFKHSYLNMHVLISHTASALNRDNNNLQKTMVFGGVKRARVSSQSLKYAMRTSSYYDKKLGKPSDRTREILELTDKYVKTLSSKYSSEIVTKTISLLAGKDLEELAKEAESGKGTSAAIIPWSLAEVEAICKEVVLAEKEGLNDKQLAKKLKDKRDEILKAFGSTVDIALSGRMTTSGLIEPVDGSMALAHSFTTHQHESQLDWFTAVDSFTNKDTNKVQAGHIGTQDFATGTFYRYCSLNLGQLRKNIGGDKEHALDIAAHLTYMLSTVVPSGKQNSFAAFNVAEYLLCSFSDQPISLADAFERPIQKDREGGFMLPSIEALQAYSKLLHEGYLIENTQNEFNLLAYQSELDSEKTTKTDKTSKVEKGKATKEKPTIAKIQDWIRKEGI